MTRIIVAAAVAAAMLITPVAHGGAGPEGCIATNPTTDAVSFGEGTTCSYRASVPGNIIASGSRWKVEVWWNRPCGTGAPDWVRRGPDDQNTPGAATWEGSIAAGSCARATAGAVGSIVAIGEVRPSTGPGPGPLETPLGCLAAAVPTASTCDVTAGTEADETLIGGGELKLGGRGSFIASGSWTVQVFATPDCTGAPFRTFSDADGTNIPDPALPGAYGNNGGVWYGYCARATALVPGSWVAIGPIESSLLP